MGKSSKKNISKWRRHADFPRPSDELKPWIARRFSHRKGYSWGTAGSVLPHFEAGDVEIGICPTELIKVNIFIQSLLLTDMNPMKISWKSHENPRFPLKSGRFVFLGFASLTARQARPRSVTEAATGGRITGWGGFVISRGAGAQWPWLLGKPVTAVELVFQVIKWGSLRNTIQDWSNKPWCWPTNGGSFNVLVQIEHVGRRLGKSRDQ